MSSGHWYDMKTIIVFEYMDERNDKLTTLESKQWSILVDLDA